jgi:hypothetical protein
MRLLRNRFRSRFGLVAVAAAGAAVVLAAPPAFAEPAGADLQFTVAGTKVSLESAGKPFFVHMHNDGPADAENVVAKIDLAGLDTSKLGIEPPTGCGDPDGTIYTCTVGSLVPGENDNGFSPFSVLWIEDNVEAGSAGSYTVEVTSDTPDPNPDNNKKITVPVEITPLAYDLFAALTQDVWANPDAGEDSRERIAPGATAPLIFEFLNAGELTAKDIVWKVTLPPFVTFPASEQRDGCTFNATRTVVSCELPGALLGPGDALSSLIGEPMLVQVAADAPGPGALVGGIIDAGAKSTVAPVSTEVAARATAAVADDVKVAKASTELKKKAAAAGVDEAGDADPSDNVGRFSVHTAANGADLQITGGSGSGAVGATVTIPVTVKNNGPASSPNTTVTVTAPTGTELVDLPTNCEFVTPGKAAKCEGLLAAGEENVGTFAFKIAASTIADDGKATISGTLEDRNESNNTSAITITIGSGGGLPITGVKVSVIGGVGAAVLAAGAGLVLFARRRRVQLVTPSNDA